MANNQKQALVPCTAMLSDPSYLSSHARVSWDHIGRKSLQKIEELLATGKLRRLQSLKSTDRSQAIGELTKIHGVGSKTAASWFAKGISTIEEASTAGIMNHTQRTGARFYQDLEHRIPREEVSDRTCFPGCIPLGAHGDVPRRHLCFVALARCL